MSVGLVDFVESADIGVIEGGGGFGFLFEAPSSLVVAQQMRRQEFQRHGAVEFGVDGLVNDTHPAFAEFFANQVVRNSFAHHELPG